MKKISSFTSLFNLKNISVLKNEITTRVYYSTAVNEITDEFIEETPIQFISSFHDSFDNNAILESITGTPTPHLGLGIAINDICHLRNAVLIFFVYFIWYQSVTMEPQYIKNVQNKIGNYIDIETIQKHTKLVLLIIFIVFTRNVGNVI